MLNDYRKKGIKIRHTGSNVLHDYAGMNDEAAKKLGFTERGKVLKDKTVLIDKNLPYKTKCRNLTHEVVEMNLMEKKKYPYWKAHKIALRAEKSI